MADLNALYSYQGQEPRPLPHEISYTESWGATNFRQSVESFTDEEIQRAGYTGPYTKPEYDQKYENLNWNGDNLQYEVTPKTFEKLFVNFSKELEYFTEIANHFCSESILYPSSITLKNKKIEFNEYLNLLNSIKQNPPTSRQEIINFSWPLMPQVDRLTQENIDMINHGISISASINELNDFLILNNVNFDHLHSDDQDIIISLAKHLRPR